MNRPKCETSVKFKRGHRPLLILVLLLSRLSLAQQPCFSDGKFPKMTNGESGESWTYSMVASETLNEVFQGGAMEAPNLDGN